MSKKRWGRSVPPSLLSGHEPEQTLRESGRQRGNLGMLNPLLKWGLYDTQHLKRWKNGRFYHIIQLVWMTCFVEGVWEGTWWSVFLQWTCFVSESGQILVLMESVTSCGNLKQHSSVIDLRLPWTPFEYVSPVYCGPRKLCAHRRTMHTKRDKRNGAAHSF